MEDFHMKRSRGLVLVAAAVLAIGVGCAKKKVAQTPPPTPPAPERHETTTTPAPERHEVASTPRREEPAPRSNMPDAATRKRIDDLLARIEDADRKSTRLNS